MERMYPGLVEDISQFEGGGMDEEETVGFFQRLIDCKLAWKLQGCYGRTASDLIAAGVCHQ